jgi:Zn-dependent protease
MFEIITLAILILSIVLHEVAHGYAANWLGDPTARLAGRLSPNPLLHIDPMGSVIIPGLLFMSGAQFLFGYAKPVPYNPYNLRNAKWGESIVAAAGPLTNLFLAGVFAVIIRMADTLALSSAFVEMAGYVVFINILLALFNAIPFPPLDGSKIIVPFLPRRLAYSYQMFSRKVESLGFITLLIAVFLFMFILWKPFITAVYALYALLLGI